MMNWVGNDGKNLNFKLSFFKTQLTFTCSKPTIETLEKIAKYVQS